MVHVTGTVHDVSDSPDRVERIIVRAVEPRMHGTTYITEESAQFPVVDGVLDFEVLPGPCVVAFLRHHGATTYEKLLVPDVEEATFKECLESADLAEGATKDTLENAIRQVQQELSKVAPLVSEVRTLHTEVSNDRTAVDGFAKAAQKSASDAATSQSKAKTSETNAANSAASAKSQQESAKTYFNNTVTEAGKAADSAAAAKSSETNAASHKQAAATSESNAATHKTNAGESAAAAASSAAEAKGHADRAEVAADPDGLRNVLTQQIADLVDGAPEDLDTIREVAEYAQANRGITDQLNAAIGDKANKSHTHTTSQVTGLDTALSGKADKTHTHAISDVADLQTELDSKPTHSTMNSGLDGKANKSHTHAQSDITGLSTALNNKAAKTHSHTTADITDFSTEMGKKANASHTHTTAQVDGLDNALTGKADTGHKHPVSDLTDYPGHSVSSGVAFYGWIPAREPDSGNIRVADNPAERYHVTNKAYVDARPALFSGAGAPPSSIAGAVAGDWWLDTSTMELHKITGV